MTFEQADKLCTRIIDFLISCGGPYKERNSLIETNILLALRNRQFVIKIQKGEIKYFVCYWRLREEDLNAPFQHEIPSNITEGETIYVVEMGNKEGRYGLVEMIQRLKAHVKKFHGVFWYRHRRDDFKVYSKLKERAA